MPASPPDRLFVLFADDCDADLLAEPTPGAVLSVVEVDDVRCGGVLLFDAAGREYPLSTEDMPAWNWLPVWVHCRTRVVVGPPRPRPAEFLRRIDRYFGGHGAHADPAVRERLRTWRNAVASR